jgi:hypothetical protein
MARTPDILYIGQPAATDTDLYTVPAATKATITQIHVANTDAATKYFSLHIKQSGDAVAADVCIAQTQKLVGTGDTDGGGTWTFDIPIPLNTVGDVISGIQETATACTVTIIGFTEPA